VKVAFIYTGGMRSFDKCWKNHAWQIWRHFPGAKFYVCTEDDEDASKVNLFGDRAAMVRTVKQPEMVIPAGCPDSWTPGQPYMHEPYHISVDPRAVLGQLWMLREGWRLYEEANDPADLIIRIRPDLWFHSFDSRFICPTGMPIHDWAFTPWWGRFGGINDRFAILGPEAARHYFTTYDKIPAMIAEGGPLHPETLVHYAMKRAGISICDDMKAEFSTLRKSGEMRFPEISMIDVAHFKS
jgi:hypothetical protein